MSEAKVVADNDVIGQVALIRQMIEAGGWADSTSLSRLEFLDFNALGLANDATDRAVWLTCQQHQVVLITANRSGKADSLDEVIAELGAVDSLPVITVGNAQKVLHDRSYAEACSFSLLDFLERLDSLRGVGRLFIP